MIALLVLLGDLSEEKGEVDMIYSSRADRPIDTRHLLGMIPSLGQRHETSPSLFVSCWIYCFRLCFEKF